MILVSERNLAKEKKMMDLQQKLNLEGKNFSLWIVGNLRKFWLFAVCWKNSGIWNSDHQGPAVSFSCEFAKRKESWEENIMRKRVWWQKTKHLKSFTLVVHVDVVDERSSRRMGSWAKKTNYAADPKKSNQRQNFKTLSESRPQVVSIGWNRWWGWAFEQYHIWWGWATSKYDMVWYYHIYPLHIYPLQGAMFCILSIISAKYQLQQEQKVESSSPPASPRRVGSQSVIWARASDVWARGRTRVAFARGAPWRKAGTRTPPSICLR